MKPFINMENIEILDLTHTLTSKIPQWDEGCGFRSTIKVDYSDCNSTVKFQAQTLQMAAGIGTHIDAPSHCIAGAKTIADIPLHQLIAPCFCIDVSNKVHERYSLSPFDIEEFESRHGNIQKNSIVICYTGWSQYWHEPVRYRNNLIFPSISEEAAGLLLKREISAVGIDTLSPDRAEDHFPVHHMFLSADKFIIENACNADRLPPAGSYILALPIKIQNGSEAPARLIALIPKN